MKAKGPLVIYFGGNAEEVSGMLEDVGADPAIGWLLTDYRGYGASEGKPSETALAGDALLWYDHAVKEWKPPRVFVFGRSLGSGVAAALAAARPVAGVIMATPYDSLAAVAKRHYWYLPVDWLLKHRFDSLALAPRLGMPLLCLVAERDEIIPPSHADRLFAAWNGAKRRVALRGVGHDDADGSPDYWPAVRAFVAGTAG